MHLHAATVRALIVRRGFWGMLYYNYNKEPLKTVLVIIQAYYNYNKEPLKTVLVIIQAPTLASALLERPLTSEVGCARTPPMQQTP